MHFTRGYAITHAAVAAERARSGADVAHFDLSRLLALVDVPLPALGEHDLRLKILAVSAEHNVVHAALADTVDILAIRGGVMVLGNSAVAEVIEVGPRVTSVKPGAIVQTHCSASQDRYGYPLRIWGYDALGSTGWYAEEAVVSERQVLPLPLDCGLTLWEMAALPLRAPTAYHLWRRGLAMFRAKVGAGEKAVLNVLSFGGGVGELFLMLARSAGHRAFFCSGTSERRAALAAQGVEVLDQTAFGRFSTQSDVDAFRAHCRDLADGEGMHIVCDMLRGSCFDAGIAVAARQGVNVSAGWQLSQQVCYNSALLSVRQITLDHVHYDTVTGCRAAIELYGRVFKPQLHHELYRFADLPRCFEEMRRNLHTGIAIVRVASEMPTTVSPIV